MVIPRVQKTAVCIIRRGYRTAREFLTGDNAFFNGGNYSPEWRMKWRIIRKDL